MAQAQSAVWEVEEPQRDRVVVERRYLVLCAVLTAGAIAYALQQRWLSTTDAWEHAAAVRELARHPFSPEHPLLPVDAPHQLENPYALLLAFTTRVTGLSLTTVFALGGLLNLGLMFVGTAMFVGRLTRRPA